MLMLCVCVCVCVCVCRPYLAGMLLVSDNSATAACIAALHRGGMLPSKLMSLFQSVGLPTLNLNNTQPGGYWGGVYATRNRSSDADTTVRVASS